MSFYLLHRREENIILLQKRSDTPARQLSNRAEWQAGNELFLKQLYASQFIEAHFIDLLINVIAVLCSKPVKYNIYFIRCKIGLTPLSHKSVHWSEIMIT